MPEAIYEQHGLYDQLLPTYEFDGRTDEELLAAELATTRRERRGRALEIGCGTGRMTKIITAHAGPVTCVDSSRVMLNSAHRRRLGIRVVHADARIFVTGTREQSLRPTFDLIVACWSLNYPLLACFETNSGTEIMPKPLDQGFRDARTFLVSLTDMIAPSGELIVFFFDPESDEQRFVTRVWERIAPFPGSGRDFTLRLLLNHLASTPGTLNTENHWGHMRAPSLSHAQRWFMDGHFKGFPAITDEGDTRQIVAEFLRGYQNDNGTIAVPAGMHTVRFTPHPHPQPPGGE